MNLRECWRGFLCAHPQRRSSLEPAGQHSWWGCSLVMPWHLLPLTRFLDFTGSLSSFPSGKRQGLNPFSEYLVKIFISLFFFFMITMCPRIHALLCLQIAIHKQLEAKVVLKRCEYNNNVQLFCITSKSSTMSSAVADSTLLSN